MLAENHRALIEASAISPGVADERGYFTATTKTKLGELGFGGSQRLVPALVVPVHGVDGDVVTYQARPDQPRVVKGKALKYETPSGSRMALDVPPAIRDRLGDPGLPLFITEGARKADSAVTKGLCCVAVLGVWNWRGNNGNGGKTALADWERIALNGRKVYIAFDSDAMVKTEVYNALDRLAAFLRSRAADVRFVYLPALDGGAKCGLDDYFAAGATVDDVLAHASDELRRPAGEPASDGKPPEPQAPLRPTDELLAEVAAFIDRYVSLPTRKAAMAITLWTIHTWAFDAAHSTPYLVLRSPTKRSGKTRLQEVLELVVRSPWRVAAASEAAMFRKISDQRPTLLLDEVDAIFGSKAERTEPVRGLLNAGNRPGASVARVVGEGKAMAVQDFSVYCPKVLAGIDTGRWPDTILDRAVKITLHRKSPSAELARFRHRKASSEAEPLRVALERWAGEHVEVLRNAEPVLPVELDDRAAEAWEPLFAIADLAGEVLGRQARRTAIALAAGQDGDDDGHRVRLLRALRDVFGDDPVLASAEILEAINDDDGLPFGAWRDGKGLDARTLANLLKPFEIQPRSVRRDAGTKGYYRKQFTDAWERYTKDAQTDTPPSDQDLADRSDTSQSQSQKSPVFDPTHGGRVSDEKSAQIPLHERDVLDVLDETRSDGPPATTRAENGHEGETLEQWLLRDPESLRAAVDGTWMAAP